jgi:hypothetical protein
MIGTDAMAHRLSRMVWLAIARAQRELEKVMLRGFRSGRQRTARVPGLGIGA